MKRYVRPKHKKCSTCNKSFVGAIDPSGKFCSTYCLLKYIPSAPESMRQTCHQRRVAALYPFNCKNCNALVAKGNGDKAHQKRLCRKKCKLILLRKPKHNVDGSTGIEPKYAKESALKEKLYGSSFYTRPEWLKLRYQALAKYGRKCQLCGATDKVIHVDHIKPKSKYPELALVLSNLQVLCEPCNLGKGAWDETDWRPAPSNASSDT